MFEACFHMKGDTFVIVPHFSYMTTTWQQPWICKCLRLGSRVKSVIIQPEKHSCVKRRNGVPDNTVTSCRALPICVTFSMCQIEDKHRWRICVWESDFDEFVEASPSKCSFVAALQHWSAKIYVFVCCTHCSAVCMFMSQSALMVCHCIAVYRPGMQTLVFSLPMKTQGRKGKTFPFWLTPIFCGSRLKAP